MLFFLLLSRFFDFCFFLWSVVNIDFIIVLFLLLNFCHNFSRIIIFPIIKDLFFFLFRQLLIWFFHHSVIFGVFSQLWHFFLLFIMSDTSYINSSLLFNSFVWLIFEFNQSFLDEKLSSFHVFLLLLFLLISQKLSFLFKSSFFSFLFFL